MSFYCSTNTLSTVHTKFSFLCVSQMNFAREQFQGTQKEWVLLVCIGASSGVGRLTFGKIGDLIPGLKKIYMQVRKCVMLENLGCSFL